ncbi:MAG: isoprenylcysteine carboxylmethyltransferase family protein [Nitrospirae bacterium]|nr:isoprenylcysteine carboxylmethyltransferase family protein [Nitrospirota bacterium]
MGADARDKPGVIAPPLLIYAAAFGAAVLLHALVPLRVGLWPMSAFGGTLLIAAGILLARGAFRAMGLAGTSANPYGSATALVTRGPFRWTRNPLYLAQTFLYVGMAIALNTLWPLVWLPAVLLVMRYGVIEREERYLDNRFGAAYRAYRSTVRRWV